MVKANDDAVVFASIPEDRLRRCTLCRFSHMHYTESLHRSGSYADGISCKQFVGVVLAVVETLSV